MDHNEHLAFIRLAALCLALLCGVTQAAAEGAPSTPATQTGACPPLATAPSLELMQAAMAQASDRGPLWRISRDGHDSFLYGTLHIGKALWMAPGPVIRNALRQSDTIALELDPMDDAVQAEMAARLAALPSVVLAPALQARLARAWQFECLPANALDSGPPEMKAIALLVLAGRRDGLDPAYASEVMLAALARLGKRRLVSLETVSMQLDVLMGQTAAEVEDMVRETLDELEADPNRATMMRMVIAWAAGDVAELERYDQWCECVNSDAERARMKRMLDERNPGMARGIDELHAAGGHVFAAVGTLHMTGGTGLPALLAARGYAVQRLR